MKCLVVLILLSYLCLCSLASGQTQIIQTVAGGGTSGLGDQGQATSASLNLVNPNVPLTGGGVFVDASGNLFIADTGNARIRKVTPGGIITTVAGNGCCGYGGDGQQATSASLNQPQGVAVDASGNIYIADTGNNVIRKVAANGVISTVAGKDLLVGFFGDGGPASAALLYSPAGVAVNTAGDLFIADTVNNVIRKVTASTGNISTVAGNTTQGFAGDGAAATSAELYLPTGVFVDASGNIFIADRGNNRIRKVSASGTITTVAGNGTGVFSGDGGVATAAGVASPTTVAVDASGNIFIAVTLNSRIREVAAGTGIITTVAGDGVAGFFGDGGLPTNAGLNHPDGVAVDASGDIFIADTINNRIREVSAVSNTTPAVMAVVNAATQIDATHGVAPNSFISIYSSNIGTVRIPNLFPTTNFQGLEVLFNGNPAPLYSVTPSANQINLVVPSELPSTGTATVNVLNSFGMSASVALTLAKDSVGVFRNADAAHPNNAAVELAGTLEVVMPASTAAAYGFTTCTTPVTATCAQPAHPGDNIVIYFEGGGLATPNADPLGQPVATGSVAPVNGNPLYKTVQTPTVTIGGIAAPVTFSGIAPGTAAEYQLNTQIPAAVQPGDSVPVVLTFATSSDTVTIAVKAP